MARLDGKVALISGAARGMGAEEARLFAGEGAKVVVADVLDDEASAVASSIGDASLAVHLDVTSEAEWAAAVTSATEAFGRLDVLVNNAGILRVMPTALETVEGFMRVAEVNQLGVFLGMRAVIDAMTRAGGGSIINISSIAGLVGAPGHLAYCASKWAVRGMTKVAAAELAPVGIRVNSIHPGLIDTPMLDEYRALGIDTVALTEGIPLGRLATAADVAPMALYLASDESRYSTGSEFVVDGGIVARSPRQ